MKKTDLVDLLRIGLTEGEAKIYVALLELGPSSVGPVRKRTKIAHSNIYEILDRLIEKGIVTTIIKNNVTIFQAVNPSNLSRFLDKKEAQLKKEREILAQALPRIEALQEAQAKQEAQLFVGLKGLQTAYTEMYKEAKKGDENLWVYVHDKKYEEVSDRFYSTMWRQAPTGVVVKGIADTSYKKAKFSRIFKKKYELRYASFPLFSHGEVFQNKFLLISWEEPVTAILTTSRHITENFRDYFESVWKKAKP